MLYMYVKIHEYCKETELGYNVTIMIISTCNEKVYLARKSMQKQEFLREPVSECPMLI